jgi:hypothetical protein
MGLFKNNSCCICGTHIYLPGGVQMAAQIHPLENIEKLLTELIEEIMENRIMSFFRQAHVGIEFQGHIMSRGLPFVGPAQ